MRTLFLSLQDLLGKEYTEAVCAAQAYLTGSDVAVLREIAGKKVDFYPESLQARLSSLLPDTGTAVLPEFPKALAGAGSASFSQATRIGMAPLAALGFFRTGENGRLYLTTKSEHYHASLGHNFPGFELIEYAKKLGIAQITHNNTRGFISRLLERELIRCVNSLPAGDDEALERVLASSSPKTLNRVINLQTGSLAVEAALKMVLARFYRFQDSDPQPEYAGRIPVILVMADNSGGRSANYHGTAFITQLLRGLWPDFLASLEKNGMVRVAPVRINDIGHFRETAETYDKPPFKAAAFFHEIILMNYGAVRLTKEYLTAAHAVCAAGDIPTVVDEIQSSIWYPGLFLFKEYGLEPDFVSVGKGFPGGQYASSRIITTPKLDTLSQFGALVTNGQEELSSLAYLITMAFASANEEHIRTTGLYYEQKLAELKARHPDVITEVEGKAHLSSLFFKTAGDADNFSQKLNRLGIDISAHTYKANSAPSALTKLPLTADRTMIDFLISRMEEALKD
ncbi:MAG: aminotransferase class III-fold pyridoxal phosphate-dependent enzyme [Spirochaetales bacterium]|nr:MAG: aminotransferase class III-fold pyridoxal phosphate-dependent enzyme [Spirochaetales bacterium]